MIRTSSFIFDFNYYHIWNVFSRMRKGLVLWLKKYIMKEKRIMSERARDVLGYFAGLDYYYFSHKMIEQIIQKKSVYDDLVLAQITAILYQQTQYKGNLDNMLKNWVKLKNAHYLLTAIIVICIYFFGILPDLPISNIVDSYYMKHLSGVKDFFQEKEARLSVGHEKYPHLFRIEKKQNLKKNQEAVKKKVVSLKLKKIKSKKITIRKKPSMKANIITKIKSKDKVIYKYRYRKVGKRYWLKVYLPVKKISGWIDSRYVNKSQLKKILKRKYAS